MLALPLNSLLIRALLKSDFLTSLVVPLKDFSTLSPSLEDSYFGASSRSKSSSSVEIIGVGPQSFERWATGDTRLALIFLVTVPISKPSSLEGSLTRCVSIASLSWSSRSTITSQGSQVPN